MNILKFVKKYSRKPCFHLMSTLECICGYLVAVLKTTTLMEHIASFMIEPRPWLIVFGKKLTNDVFESRATAYLKRFVSFFAFEEEFRSIQHNDVIKSVTYYKHKPLVLSEEQKKDNILQFRFIKSFLLHKTPSVFVMKTPSVANFKFLCMERLYILMFTHFNSYFKHQGKIPKGLKSIQITDATRKNPVVTTYFHDYSSFPPDFVLYLTQTNPF
jgi:hypothetical protein